MPTKKLPQSTDASHGTKADGPVPEVLWFLSTLGKQFVAVWFRGVLDAGKERKGKEERR